MRQIQGKCFQIMEFHNVAFTGNMPSEDGVPYSGS
jgi:hypothetical protein